MFQGFSPGNLKYLIMSLKSKKWQFFSPPISCFPVYVEAVVLGALVCFISPAFNYIWDRKILIWGYCSFKEGTEAGVEKAEVQ